ncbi:hypothetical protein H17ap60334_08533 [Thermosipho africanus H17ap60334]|uniref:UPF0273 protein THA_115 n=1 Tax=Thermosipho africanus (strain TCF52B) TaxID=484019 RepID=B7IEV9_THEAB|nr:KaiC domain-containing protein [Thermosipho africanus]ACJ74623.1 ATPase, RecA superfamily [Thermosipho africanus TCF52B]EKF48931.1 hypothetical protein H17ap60334_08533 [Thermosipho africanus H17ap60334]MDK2839263.1 hypothetical protein [Thermosipho sp. (in: thermotogales)]
MKKVSTGIIGLDEILNGGIPEKNVVLLSGGPGTGKSIFSQQFLWHGLQNNEPGIYVALEEHPIQVRQNMSQFGWNIKPFEEKGLFALIDAFTAGFGKSKEFEKYIVRDLNDLHDFIDVLRQAIKDINAKRVVIDSVTTLYLNKPTYARSIILQLKRVLAGTGCTSLLVSQVSIDERGFGGPGVEHGVDGIIRLDLDEIKGELKRSLLIWKMRGTSHSLKRHYFEITQSGIKIVS